MFTFLPLHAAGSKKILWGREFYLMVQPMNSIQLSVFKINGGYLAKDVGNK